MDAVRRAPDLELVGSFGHGAAIAWEGDWSTVDVAVVDAADERSEGDQFPGVGVVRHIRTATQDGPRPTVVVVTGHYLHDGLRHRMADADADFFFLRSDLRSPADLVDVIIHPERYRRGVAPVADIEGRGPSASTGGPTWSGSWPTSTARGWAPSSTRPRPGPIPAPAVGCGTGGPWPRPAPSRR